MKQININEIEGFQIGQCEASEYATGVSVIISPQGACASCDIRGGGPATRESDLLDPRNLVDKIHAVVLSGGSAFGLDSASGVMRYLEERKIGFDMKVATIPIVCGAALFDLSLGDSSFRDYPSLAYQACLNSEQGNYQNGNYGAGCGASVGKLLGFEHAMKGGIGSYALELNGLKVGAIVAVNARGNVVDDTNGEILAGVYDQENKRLISHLECIEALANVSQDNTTIACIITNAKLTKAQCQKVAGIAHNGYAKTIYPVHTMSDGDSIFVMANGEIDTNIDIVGVLATQVISESIKLAIKSAKSAYGAYAYEDIK